jgi:hypothetical protein
MKWFEICSDPPASYQDNGSFWRGDCESSFDIVAYVSPLPAEILQRMAEALEAAEYCPQQTTPATFGEVLKAMAENGADETAQPIECQLCGTIVNEPRVEWQYCNACTQEQSQ